MKDEIEMQLEQAIRRAMRDGDNDTAHQHSVTLRQYQAFYKLGGQQLRRIDALETRVAE